jgi:hypothetical protein
LISEISIVCQLVEVWTRRSCLSVRVGVAAFVAAQESDARQVSMAIDGEIERDENKAAAILYVGAAEKSDVDEMLSMISPITRKKQGDDAIRRIFTKIQIPLFSHAKVNMDTCVQTPINDQDGTTGSMFACTLNLPNYGAVTAHITVLNEGGSYVSAVDFTDKSH